MVVDLVSMVRRWRQGGMDHGRESSDITGVSVQADQGATQPFSSLEGGIGVAESGPSVSVCIPTYNRARYIGNAITSVLNQTFQDFELIIYDDASTDETRRIVQSYDDPRIRYFRHAWRRGIPVNRNACLRVARGRYIGWLDSDDSYLPHMLAEQTALLDRFPNVGLVHAKAIFVNEHGKSVARTDWAPCTDGEVIEDGFEVFKELCVSNYVAVPTVLVRRACYERVGGYKPELDSGEDSEMWLRIALCYDIAYRARPIAYKRMHEGNVRSVLHARKLTANRRKVVRAIFGSAPRRNGVIGSLRRLAASGATCFSLQRLKQARGSGESGLLQLGVLSEIVRLDPTLLLNRNTWNLASAILRSSEPEFQLAYWKLTEHVVMRVQDTRVGRSWLVSWFPDLSEQARVLLHYSAAMTHHSSRHQAVLRDAEAILLPFPATEGVVLALEGGFLLLQRDVSGHWQPLNGPVPHSEPELPAFLTWLQHRNARHVIVSLELPARQMETVFQAHVKATGLLLRETARWSMYRLVAPGEEIDAAMRVIPERARVLVVSKGDQALVELEGREGWHFPRAQDGSYAGYYPADSAEAIAHLEALRAQGAQFLLFPRTAFWWLEHYAEFRLHLEQRYPCLPVPDDACRVFALERESMNGPERSVS